MSSTHIDTLELLLKAGKGAVVPEFKVALSRLSTEIKDRVSRGSSSSVDFFVGALDALARIRGAANAELRMSCLHDCAAFFFNGGLPSLALKATKELDFLARTTGNKLWRGKAHNLMGLVHADAANVADALPHYAEALSLRRQIEDFDGEAGTLINLGVALNYASLYREAIPCFQKAAEIATTRPEVSNRRNNALSNLAQSYLYLEEYESALCVIRESLIGEKEPYDYASALSRTVREFTYVQIALELGKIALARQHSAECARHARWDDNARCQALPKIARALCEIHGGDAETGLALLESLLSVDDDLVSVRTDVLTALVRAYDQVSRPELALQYHRKLLEHVRSVRERGVRSLFSLPVDMKVVPGSSDLRALEHRETRLRAQVAEREMARSQIEMLERLAVTADLKEEASGLHGYRVGRLAALLAAQLDWSRDACSAIDLAARLHDIGKIGMPDRILMSSQELQDAQRRYMNSHTIIGAELLAKSNTVELQLAEEIARYHHEWWDGSGYPSKLLGKRIPIHARIVALADVFDALTHGRPYAEPWTIPDALKEINGRRGTQFDPELTDSFLALIERLRTEHEDLDAYLGKAGRNSPFLQARNKIRLMLAEERENERKATVTGNETRH